MHHCKSVSNVVITGTETTFPGPAIITNVKLKKPDGSISKVETSLTVIKMSGKSSLIIYNFVPAKGNTEDKKILLDWIKRYAAHYNLLDHLYYLN